MTIKTLEYIHGLLQDNESRLSAEAEKARKKVDELEAYYNVRAIYQGWEKVKYTADDHQEEWQAGGKAFHSVAVAKLKTAKERVGKAESALIDFEAQEF